MSISKKIAVAAAFVGLIGGAAFAQEPQDAPPGPDMTVSIPPIEGEVEINAPLPPVGIGPMGFDPMDMIAEGPDGPPDAAMPPPGPPGEGPMMMAHMPPGGPGGGGMMWRHHGGGGGCHRGNPFADLNLTDDQYEKLFALRRDTAGNDAGRMGELMKSEMQLHDLMLQPDIDRAKITATQNHINQIKSELANSRLDKKLAMISILTPEQRKQLRQNMLHRMAGPFGRGGSCPKKGGPGGK